VTEGPDTFAVADHANESIDIRWATFGNLRVCRGLRSELDRGPSDWRARNRRRPVRTLDVPRPERAGHRDAGFYAPPAARRGSAIGLRRVDHGSRWRRLDLKDVTTSTLGASASSFSASCNDDRTGSVFRSDRAGFASRVLSVQGEKSKATPAFYLRNRGLDRGWLRVKATRLLERRLWRGLRSFPRRCLYACFPPI
jgi:hypothetical protein